MDLEETEARNDCAGETSSNLTNQPKDRGKIPIAGSRYIATPSEDTEALMLRTVICTVCRCMKLLQLPVVMSYKCSINPIIN
jgi:hypothetical protein